jgi:hypothetical protein
MIKLYHNRSLRKMLQEAEEIAECLATVEPAEQVIIITIEAVPEVLKRSPIIGLGRDSGGGQVEGLVVLY